MDSPAVQLPLNPTHKGPLYKTYHHHYALHLWLKTHYLSEQPSFQIWILETMNKLLRRWAGDGSEFGVVLTLLGDIRQSHGKELDAVAFGLCGRCHHVRISRMVNPIGHQHCDPDAVVRRLLHKHLRGVGDCIAGVCTVADVAHGDETVVKRIQVFPGQESMLDAHRAAVLERSHPDLHGPTVHLQPSEQSAESQHKGLLALKQNIFGAF